MNVKHTGYGTIFPNPCMVVAEHAMAASFAVCCRLQAEAMQRSPVSLDQECARLERDVEEGSRRLAMAHKEIRHLTDELESAHLTQRAYALR